MVVEEPLTQVSQQLAASVVRNLRRLTSTMQSKFVGNIMQNIQLAAAYVGVITVVSEFLSTHSLIKVFSFHRVWLI